METRSPELIFASYSCARLDHIVRLMRARPFSVLSALLTTSGEESLRMPTALAFATGTRSVILSFSKVMTKSSSFVPATSCSSTFKIRPTPCVGYTTWSFDLNSCFLFELAGTFLGAAATGAVAVFAAVISVPFRAPSRPCLPGWRPTASSCTAIECGAGRIVHQSGVGERLSSCLDRHLYNMEQTKKEGSNH